MTHFSAYPTILVEPYAWYSDEDQKRFIDSGWICFCDDGEVRKDADGWQFVHRSDEAYTFMNR